jgi:integrase
VDVEQRVVHVRQTVTVVRGAPHVGPPKSKSSRRAVPVPAQVMAALREHRARQNAQRLSLGALWQDNDLVFATAVGTPINPNNLTRDYNRWVAQAGVPRIRIHDQRHTHVTLALASGANLKAVSQRVGHAKTSITMDLYAHVLPEQHRDVSDKVCAALFGAGERAVTNS